MGIVRILLALSVVALHLPPYKFSPIVGHIAVPLFYVISGYLISYILTSGSQYSHASTFYLNRILRLYPMYYVVIFLCLLVFWWEPYDWQNFDRLPVPAQVLLPIVNITIVGQDWTFLFASHGSVLTATTNPHDSDFFFPYFLLDDPSWTLGVELTFYLIAPFVLKRRAWILILLAGSLIARVVAVRLGANPMMTLGYHFFPFELSMFLIGALSQQYLSPVVRRIVDRTESLPLEALVTLVVVTLLVVGFFAPPNVESWWFERTVQAASGFSILRMTAAIILAIALPFLAIFQSRKLWDTAVGDLSYPIYICHRVVILALFTWSQKHATALTDSVTLALAMVGGSVILALMLNRVVGRQIEPIRRRVKSLNGGSAWTMGIAALETGSPAVRR